MKMNFDIKENGITLKTTIPIYAIQQLEIDFKENEHGRGIIEAQILKEYYQEVSNTYFGGDAITVWGKEDQMLFAGIIERAEFEVENTYVKVIIYCISNTILMDIKKKKRSFQDLQMNYTQIINRVIKEYDSASFIWQTEPDTTIEHPFIQFDETDWEFLKRLATHFHTVLYPEYQSTQISFCIGCKHGSNRGQIQQGYNGSFKCGICNSYYTKGGYKKEKNREDATYLEIVNEDEWDIGDVVQYEQQNYMVYRKRIIFSKGETIYKYVLGKKYFIYQEKVINSKLAGVGIKGKIERVQKQNVYLHLEIDNERNIQYPWVWKPETGNLCYCMPEVGTDAMLYFASGDEHEGLVSHTLRINPDSSIFSNIGNREIHTLHDKRMALYPDKLFVEGKAKTVGIYLEDEHGIQFRSKKGVQLNAVEGIYISGKKGTFCAPTDIICRTSQSNIEINRDFNFYAPGGVQTNGTKNETHAMPVLASPEKKADHWQLAFSAMAAIPTVDFTKIDDDGVVELMAEAAIPQIATGKTALAMSDVMNGKPESEVRHANALRSMELYTVKGGYPLPVEKR